jgi:CubicO group peptidase (beta-lactamase class C family)
VTAYLPDYDTQGRRVPVRRLLDHTSGIASFTSLPEFQDFEKRAFPRDSLVKIFSKKPFTFEPGALEAYNNSGFFLLGLIIEKVTGTSYADYVKRNLFDRAGMKDSRYCSATEVVPGMAHGYDMGPTGLQRAAYIDFTWPYAAGSLCSTVADLDAWNQALHGGKVLGPAAYEQLTTPGTLNDGSRLRYAKGIAVSKIAGHRALHHGGDIPGFATYLAYFPEQRLSIAVTVNSEGPVRPDAISASIAERVLGKPATPVATLKSETAREYVGSYAGIGGMGEDLTVKVHTDSAGRLALDGGPLTRHDSPSTLAYMGTDTFQLDDKQLTFVREKGRVVRLRVDAVYAHLVLERKP